MTLFADLKKAIGTEWTDYTEHEFVRKLGEGTCRYPSSRTIWCRIITS